MKKQFLFLMLIVIVFVGCSSDSDSNSLPINEENLLGKWYSKGIKLSNQPYEAYDHRCSTTKDYQEILNSHNANYYRHGTDCGVIEIVNSIWTLNGNQLTIINPDPMIADDKVYTVSITDKELIISFDYATPSGPESDKYYYTRN
jgi:hypothetical protein